MLKYYLVGLGMDIHAGKGRILNEDTIELLDPVKLIQTQQGLAFIPSFLIIPVDKAIFKYDYYSELTDNELINKINESIVSIRAIAAGLVPPTNSEEVNKIIKTKK